MLNFPEVKKSYLIIAVFIFFIILVFLIVISLILSKTPSINKQGQTSGKSANLPVGNSTTGNFQLNNPVSINQKASASDLKNYTNSVSVGKLSINYPPEFKTEVFNSNPNYLGLIKSSNPNHIKIDDNLPSGNPTNNPTCVNPKIEFNVGPTAPNDSLEKLVADWKTLRSIYDVIITEEYITLGGIPAFHEVVKDPTQPEEDTYLMIIGAQRVVITNNLCDKTNLTDLNNIVSTIISNQNPTLFPSQSQLTQGQSSPTFPSGNNNNPLNLKPTNILDRLNTQKQTNFVVPTIAAQKIIDCNYGSGQANCIPSIPRTCAEWVESGVLAAFEPPVGDTILHVWYQDEWALTLGSGNVSPLTQSPDHIINPNTGDPGVVDSAGRPFSPAIFITDITNSPDNKSGDWEYGGLPKGPTEIFGTWQPLGVQLDKSKQNGRNLGPGSVAPPASVVAQFVSEIRWDLSKFNLVSGHTYRLEFMVHDGDREGDSGEKCAIINY